MSEKRKFFCEQCKIELSGGVEYQLHLVSKKHTKRVAALERIQNEALKAKRSIFIVNIKTGTPELSIINLFDGYGRIAAVKLVSGGAACLLEFEKEESAAKVLKRKKYFLNGRPIYVREAQGRTQQIYEPGTKKPLDKSVVQEAISWTCTFGSTYQLLSLVSCVSPSQDELRARSIAQTALQNHLTYTFPVCRVVPFGSSVTGLSFPGSDIDLFVDLGPPETWLPASHRQQVDGVALVPEPATIFKAVARAVRRLRDVGNVLEIPKAKVPLIRFKLNSVCCDLSFSNPMGVQNSLLLSHLLSVDYRYKTVATLIRCWADVHSVAGLGRFTNYSLMLLLVFYLQSGTSPSMLPSVKLLQDACSDNENYIVGPWNCSFSKDRSLYANENQSSVVELAHGFFDYYAKFDYSTYVICPLLGYPIKREVFGENRELPAEMERYKNYVTSSETADNFRADTCVCLQDPFNLSHNVCSATAPKFLTAFTTECETSSKPGILNMFGLDLAEQKSFGDETFTIKEISENAFTTAMDILLFETVGKNDDAPPPKRMCLMETSYKCHSATWLGRSAFRQLDCNADFIETETNISRTIAKMTTSDCRLKLILEFHARLNGNDFVLHRGERVNDTCFKSVCDFLCAFIPFVSANLKINT